MSILIVESGSELGELWKRHLERMGAHVEIAATEQEAAEALKCREFDSIVIDIALNTGHSLVVSDLASFWQPKAKLIFVTNTSFFSDGSLFQLFPNVCAHMQKETPPEDLAAIIAHYGGSESSLMETALP